MRDIIRHFPARPLTPDERALVAEWLNSVGDVAATFVSSRRTDDAAYYRRIIIISVSQPFERRSIPFDQFWEKPV